MLHYIAYGAVTTGLLLAGYALVMWLADRVIDALNFATRSE